MNTENNSSNLHNQMLRARNLIFIGAMILFVMHLLFVLQEVTRWSYGRASIIVEFFGYLNLFLIIVPIGWIFIGLGYRQFDHQAKMKKTKTDQQNLTYWMKKSGTILTVLAIISLPFSIALTAFYLIFILTLISIIVQFILGIRLRMWNAPDISIPAEIMIPGR